VAGLVGDPCAKQETVQRLHAVDAETYADWETIYVDNVQRLYRLMYSRVGNRPDAEDLTSEVFMAALEPLRISASKPELPCTEQAEKPKKKLECAPNWIVFVVTAKYPSE